MQHYNTLLSWWQFSRMCGKRKNVLDQVLIEVGRNSGFEHHSLVILAASAVHEELRQKCNVITPYSIILGSLKLNDCCCC